MLSKAIQTIKSAVGITPSRGVALTPEQSRVVDTCASSASFYQGRQAQLYGGVGNGLSGQGGTSDKAAFFFFLHYWLANRQQIEQLYINSWAGARYINLPVDDLFTKQRQYDEDKFREESSRVNQDVQIANTMKAGRLYGTGLLWAVTTETTWEEPLDVNRLRPGDLNKLMVFDSFDANIQGVNRDLLDDNFNNPEFYRINIRGDNQYLVHHSRVFRFDGMTAMTENGFDCVQNRDWGVSALTHAVTDIVSDASNNQAVTQMVQEASIPVLKIADLADRLCSTVGDEKPLLEIVADINKAKSIYSTMLTDSKDSFERVGIQMTGLDGILGKSLERLAAMAGISKTHFLNQSPDGMNSTGAGDMKSDNQTAATRQRFWLQPAYQWLDPIIAASAGAQVPEYEFPPLFEMTEKEESEIDAKRAETNLRMTQIGAWTEDEARVYIETGQKPTGEIIV